MRPTATDIERACLRDFADLWAAVRYCENVAAMYGRDHVAYAEAARLIRARLTGV
jgi:hypothetical protein